MKTRLILIIFCFSSLSSIYSQKVLSLYSVFTEDDAILVPEFEGIWNIIELDLTISCQKAGDNFYLIQYENENSVSNFEAIFIKINNEIFLDLYSLMPDTLGDGYYRNSFVPCHKLLKIQMSMDTILLYELSYSWFYDYAVNKKSLLEYEWINNAMLLTFKTNELKSFIIEHGNEIEIFERFLSLKKNKDNTFKKAANICHDSETKSKTFTPQKCIPEFPLKDGWLGGDGDVSVLINDTSTLFMFSDTYVGNRNQQSRKESGLKMISNSVAVETCRSNGETDIRYFWNNMYSDDPQPIFKTYTDRYKFWVVDAFIVRSNLYVILGKVGPRFGAAPDEIFNFSSLGNSMAKINNPFDAPDEWNIELKPIVPYMDIRCHVIQGDYIYFFVNRNDNAQFLIRKHIDFIDNHEKPFEYYSLDKTWKEGIKAENMDTIVNGFRCNTVNYHPEMKQWVMICDVCFMDNKIKMRTATALIGPWSDEIVIYEIPEVTPGNSSYSKSNFCYLARECIQNYDFKKSVMIITYDINNTNFSEIISNPKIYTPKTISISLKKNGSR